MFFHTYFLRAHWVFDVAGNTPLSLPSFYRYFYSFFFSSVYANILRMWLSMANTESESDEEDL